jgi:PKD repeat protein
MNKSMFTYLVVAIIGILITNPIIGIISNASATTASEDQSEELQQQEDGGGETTTPLTASFGIDSTNGDTAPATFLFEADAQGGTSPYTYIWNFGDGSPQGSGISIHHTFVNPGTYVVSLTVTDSTGQTVSETREVNVRPATTTEPASPPSPPAAGSNATLVRNQSGGGEVAVQPEPIGPGGVAVDQICEMLPGGCPPDIECPPECLIVAEPSDIQQGNIAALEFHIPMNETVTVAGESEVVPTATSQFFVGTPEQIESIAIEKLRSAITDPADQANITRVEETLNTLINTATAAEMPIFKVCLKITYKPLEIDWNMSVGYNIINP